MDYGQIIAMGLLMPTVTLLGICHRRRICEPSTDFNTENTQASPESFKVSARLTFSHTCKRTGRTILETTRLSGSMNGASMALASVPSSQVATLATLQSKKLWITSKKQSISSRPLTATQYVPLELPNTSKTQLILHSSSRMRISSHQPRLHTPPQQFKLH